MPGNFTVDIPESLSGSPMQQAQKLLDMMYQLQEQLRYTLSNLGESNFNPTELDNLRVGKQLQLLYGEKHAGGIRMDDTGEGTANDAKYRMYLYTKDVDGVPIAMKLESESKISMEAGDLIYIESKGDITIRAANIRLIGNVTVNGGTIT